jgi:hypothetical protein
MSDRERFEKWCLKDSSPRAIISKDECGNYTRQDELNQLWAAWQAAQPKWQPIETAPKDGTGILGFLGSASPFRDSSQACYWFKARGQGDWRSYRYPDGFVIVYPTHWMPLPPDPSGRECGTTGRSTRRATRRAEGGEINGRIT